MRQLWAPWRMEFIRTAGEEQECFLCQAAQQPTDEETLVVRRNERCFCLLNRYPYNNGHLLIAPYRHAGDLQELTDDELLCALRLLREAQRTLNQVLRAHGYNIGANLGRSAGAGLAEHFHLHIVPRWIGDTNFMPIIGEAKVIPQALAELGRQLRAEWRT